MKKIFLLLIFIAFCVNAVAQKKWVSQRLTNRFSVSFPVAPTKTAGTTYALKDSTIIYTATYSNIAQNIKVDQKAFNQLIASNEFAGDFFTSLQVTLPRYNLADIKIKKEKNHLTYYIEGKNDAEDKTVYLKIIFVDGIYYSLSAIVSSAADIKNKDYFLNSYQISK